MVRAYVCMKKSEYPLGPLCGLFFFGKQELSNLDYYFQDGGKTGALTNQSF